MVELNEKLTILLLLLNFYLTKKNIMGKYKIKK